ncbi:MAG: hypothetical protein M1282_03870 [Chloroflexi bacterium]|nr:hypothetical protein [Chloroflexota bacterium]
MITIDTRIPLRLWAGLTKRIQSAPGVLTPLIAADGESFSELDSLPADLQPILERLAAPRGMNSLSFILPEDIFDIAIYYSDKTLEHAIALSNEVENVRVQAAPPIDEILTIVQSQLGAAQSKNSSVAFDLSPLQAWTWWACIDILRQSDSAFQTDAVFEALGRPFAMFQNLAAYFRHSLSLSLPRLDEVESALNDLTVMGSLESSPQGFVPCASIREQACEFNDMCAHLFVKTFMVVQDGSIASLYNRIMQGKSGQCLWWYKNGDKVSLQSVTTRQAVAMLEKILKEPFSLFEHLEQFVPAPPEKLTANQRKPRPPEKLR